MLIDDKQPVSAQIINIPNSLHVPFVPGVTKDGERVGGHYYKAGCDPMIKKLQDELREPCYNCACYLAELKVLRNQLGLVE